ncbi:DUF2934 domain-containing protein [Bradyrhizobium jicamae]|uniref:DUF2934 domain-containing protein n=1 Tax=Bradyrhizobium jicamae TaxID=280332 RepID=UPI0024BFBD83|nr:DUF2934 domain-containing protein [Bradyrhizobium jicamae]
MAGHRLAPKKKSKKRAYETWERHDRPKGKEDEFWQQAEQELRNEDKSSPSRTPGTFLNLTQSGALGPGALSVSSAAQGLKLSLGQSVARQTVGTNPNRRFLSHVRLRGVGSCVRHPRLSPASTGMFIWSSTTSAEWVVPGATQTWKTPILKLSSRIC